MWFFVVSVAVIVVLVLIASYITFFIAFYSSPRGRKENSTYLEGEDYKPYFADFELLMNELKSLPFEEVYITAKDGIKLYARYFHVKDGAPVQIQCHGYRGSGNRDFCGGNKMAREMGHNTLLIDQRANGKSGGNVITFGIKERQDVLCWVDYIIDRFGKDTPIILSGISMGGTTVLMTAEMGLPKNVLGIVADCPFSEPKAIISKVVKDKKIPPKLVMPFINLGAKLFGGFGLDEASALKSVKASKVPILIIHGEKDDFVPCYMSDEIYNSGKEIVTYEKFAEANHGISYMTDKKRYEKILKDFINKCIKNSK